MSTALESAHEWAIRGRQATIDASKAIADSHFGTAHQYRLLADECFAKEKALRELASPAAGTGKEGRWASFSKSVPTDIGYPEGGESTISH